jgi:DNA polymerase III delta prime subunit
LEDRIIGSCEPDALAPTLKALVTAQVLARAREKIVFHAACLSHRGQALLISGAPGAGKTTLALQLAARGFGYCGDDIALIAPDASVTGLPFAPTVKSGAWEIVGEVWPELTTTPVHRRPDGKHVKYLRLDDIDPEPHPVGWIVFLRRESGASTRFVPLEAVDAMQRIIDGACSPTRQLSLASFRALRRMLAGAPAVELIYTGSAQAADAVCEFCNDQA